MQLYSKKACSEAVPESSKEFLGAGQNGIVLSKGSNDDPENFEYLTAYLFYVFVRGEVTGKLLIESPEDITGMLWMWSFKQERMSLCIRYGNEDLKVVYERFIEFIDVFSERRAENLTKVIINSIKQNNLHEIPLIAQLYDSAGPKRKFSEPQQLKNFAVFRSTGAGYESTQNIRMEDEQQKTRNRDLIKEPFKKVPGWDSTRAIWTTLNQIRSEQGRCNYLLHKWGMVDSPLCECGEMQTIKHMVESCPIKMFKEGLTKLHEGGPTAIKWLEELNTRL
ncbi:Hypothetical protein CINCED_3A010963 [Cinara cedri]|uniref:Uncharacterized protein n=1 Tax=Cinara cedri TaxID=506608 RepID=A0A5E4MXJ5_9HEMI|nr:Hypothetical protein CINCED_3A010963 [Cinara cedri]